MGEKQERKVSYRCSLLITIDHKTYARDEERKDDPIKKKALSAYNQMQEQEKAKPR